MDYVELERSADRALGQLPAPRAPQTLLPRVLAAVAMLARRPWYARTWFTWPLPLRVGSVATAAVLMALTVVCAPQIAALSSVVSQYFNDAIAAAPGILELASAVSAIVQVAWRGVLQPVAIIGFALVVLMALTCGACWTIVNRLSLSSENA